MLTPVESGCGSRTRSTWENVTGQQKARILFNWKTVPQETTWWSQNLNRFQRSIPYYHWRDVPRFTSSFRRIPHVILRLTLIWNPIGDTSGFVLFRLIDWISHVNRSPLYIFCVKKGRVMKLPFWKCWRQGNDPIVLIVSLPFLWSVIDSKKTK